MKRAVHEQNFKYTKYCFLLFYDTDMTEKYDYLNFLDFLA